MLYLVTWLTDFALMLFIFAGTRYLAELNASSLVLGALGASFFVTCALSNAFSGRAADRLGHRRVAATGAALFTLSLVCVALVDPRSVWFHVTYTAVGFAVGLIYPPIMAWLGRGSDARSRVYLWFCLAFNLGMLSALLTGGWLYDEVGHRAPLYVAIGLTSLTLLGLFAAPSSPSESKPQPSGEAPAGSLETARLFSRLTWIANFGGMFSMSLLWFLFPRLAVEMSVSPETHGLILATGRVVVISTYCVMYFFPFWQYRYALAAAAQLVGALGLFAISQASSSIWLVAGVAALSALMGYNYFASLFYSASGNTVERKGLAFGLNEAFLGLGAAGGSLIGGVMGNVGSRIPFQIATGVILTLLLIQASLYRWLTSPRTEDRDRATAPD